MDGNNNDIYGYQPLWGNWYIEMPIGKGSFGSVYKITREEMGHKYTSAVKMISIPSEDQYREAEASFGHDEATLTGYFEDIVKNIIGEINMLYSLSGNSNIVSYQDHTVVKREDRIGWDVLIRMEYVTSLRNYLSDRQMTRDEVIRLGIDLCSALELCSRKGIIHRDIKDENIFVNEDGVFKIGDFGIARELSKSGRAASMRGTPLYMAPEIFKGDKYDASVDIYSLGIVMYKLLNNGRMPFMPSYPQTIKFRDSEDALEKRMTGQPLPIPVRSGESLGKAVLKAGAYKPEERYASATEMKQELQRVLAAMGPEERNEKVTLPNAKKEAGEVKSVQQPHAVSEATSMEPESDRSGRTVSIFDHSVDSPPYDERTVGVLGQTDSAPPMNERTVSIFDKSEAEPPKNSTSNINQSEHTAVGRNTDNPMQSGKGKKEKQTGMPNGGNHNSYSTSITLSKKGFGELFISLSIYLIYGIFISYAFLSVFINLPLSILGNLDNIHSIGYVFRFLVIGTSVFAIFRRFDEYTRLKWFILFIVLYNLNGLNLLFYGFVDYIKVITYLLLAVIIIICFSLKNWEFAVAILILIIFQLFGSLFGIVWFTFPLELISFAFFYILRTRKKWRFTYTLITFPIFFLISLIVAMLFNPGSEYYLMVNSIVSTIIAVAILSGWMLINGKPYKQDLKSVWPAVLLELFTCLTYIFYGLFEYYPTILGYILGYSYVFIIPLMVIEIILLITKKRRIAINDRVPKQIH